MVLLAPSLGDSALPTIVFPGPAATSGGTFTYIQSKSNSASTFQVASAFSTNVTANSLIVVGCISRSPANTIRVSDTQGNVYSTAAVVNDGALGIVRIGVYYALNANAGATTVTCTDSGSTATWMQQSVHEYGSSASAAFDVASSSVVLANSANPTANPMNTSVASEFVFAFSGLAGGAATAQSGTLHENFVDNTFQFSEDTVVAAAGSYSSSFTAASGDWILIQAAFK